MIVRIQSPHDLPAAGHFVGGVILSWPLSRHFDTAGTSRYFGLITQILAPAALIHLYGMMCLPAESSSEVLQGTAKLEPGLTEYNLLRHVLAAPSYSLLHTVASLVRAPVRTCYC